MQTELVIHEIKSLPTHYRQVVFSLVDKDAAKRLGQWGTFRFLGVDNNNIIPVLFFDALSQQGQLLLYENSTSCLPDRSYRIEIVPGFSDQPSSSEKLIFLASGNGLAAAIFLAKKWAKSRPLLLLESNHGFPFTIRPSQFIIKSMPAGVMGGVALLEDWQVTSRLCSRDALPGCFHGSAAELADYYLRAEGCKKAAIYVFGNKQFIKDCQNLRALSGKITEWETQ